MNLGVSGLALLSERGGRRLQLWLLTRILDILEELIELIHGWLRLWICCGRLGYLIPGRRRRVLLVSW